jgi:hypothetical protein
MQPLLASLPCVLVSSIYCVWKHYRLALLRRERQLRERVALMLWEAANRAA